MKDQYGHCEELDDLGCSKEGCKEEAMTLVIMRTDQRDMYVGFCKGHLKVASDMLGTLWEQMVVEDLEI